MIGQNSKYMKKKITFLYISCFFFFFELASAATGYQKAIDLVSERRIGIIEPIQSDEGNSSFGFVCFFSPLV